jgi:uncharacterized protein YjbI with pentapeptide repeats
MRIVKPSRLAVLTRPYRRDRVDMLGTAVLAMATLDAVPMLMPEQALWRLASEDAGGLLDLGVPKACAEYLVTGNAYTRHQADKTACAVAVRVADQEKSLLVFGDRYWLDGQATVAAPFDVMPVDWRHAYGGPECAENPHGLGTVPCLLNDVRVVPLPNVESPRRRLSRPGVPVAPEGYGAIPPDWPQRFSRMGSRYGPTWLEHQFPAFASDMDWRFFNAAPADQWWPDRPAIPARAAYDIRNMHPHLPVQRGRLPDWRARCFISRQADGAVLEEIDLRLTTAWFFPDRERVVMIWHGAIAIQEDDAADIACIMPAVELPQDGRDVDHYRDVLRRRLDPRHGAIHALRDADLAAPSLYAQAPDPALPDTAARPAARNIRAGAERRRARHRAELAAQGLDPDAYLPASEPAAPAPGIEDLVQVLERAERDREQGQALLAQGRADLLGDAQLRAFAQEAGIDLATATQPHTAVAEGRFDPPAFMRQLRDVDAALAAGAPSGAGQGAVPAALRDDLREQLDRMYLHAAHTNDPPPVMAPHRTQRTRRRVAAIYRRDRDFAGINLIGADLSGMDLRGSRFHGASLEGARLDGARLDGCDFTRAVLARVSMKGGSLAGACLSAANLARSSLQAVSLHGADLGETSLEGAHFAACSFAGAVLRRPRLDGSRFEGCDFEGASWHEAMAIKTALEACCFRQAVLNQCGFMECTLAGLIFDHARLERCAFINTRFGQDMDFSHARFETSSFSSGTQLQGACFQHAQLRQCGLRGVRLDHGDFLDAALLGSDFSNCSFTHARMDGLDAAESLFIRADFDGASLRGANLMHAIMEKTQLTHADLRDANLFGADLGAALLDETTALRGAYTDGAKLWPRRPP